MKNRKIIFRTGRKSLNIAANIPFSKSKILYLYGMATKEEAQIFFENFTGNKASRFEELAASGSERKNFVAVNNSAKYIVTANENLRENEAFYYLSDVLKNLQLNVPTIFNISENRKIYIQQFAGEATLSEIIAKEGLSERVKMLVKKTLQQLFVLQKETENKIDFSKTFEYEQYDNLPITHDLYYFKNFVVDVLEIHYHKSTLLKEFKAIVKMLEDLEPKGLMIRDFQSRNIMVNNNDEVTFIDYQGAMKGPLMYDVVSFLFQAKANFPENFKEEMLNHYYNLWDEAPQVQLKNSLKPIQLIRFMQVLGAYGFRGLVQQKKHFAESISQGIINLNSFLQDWELSSNFPELMQVSNELSTENTQQKIQQILNR